MKKINLLIAAILMIASFSLTAQVAVTTDGSSADGSAMLEVKSTDKGFLPPRMTETEMNAIANPTEGLIVYCTDYDTDGCLMVYSNAVWKCVFDGGSHDVPGAPTIGTATAGDTEALVPFTQPASNGGLTITSYTATSSPGNIIGTLTQAGSGTITVTGLSNGTAYTFTVTATNAIGTGAASAASNSVTPAAVPNVTNPTTGKIWMDRNLGATQVATSSTDYLAYGSLYQWGRLSDGHELITWTNSTSGTPVNGTTIILSTTDIPGNANFILAPAAPYDWRSGQNVNLWQGVNGVNNPCPTGYRLPTEAELTAEKTTWSSQGAAGAFGSPLKLPVAGGRYAGVGSLYGVGYNGNYWSSTVAADGTNSRDLYFTSSTAIIATSYRADGFSVRCIKE